MVHSMEAIEQYKEYLHTSAYTYETSYTYYNEAMQYFQWCKENEAQPLSESSFIHFETYLKNSFSPSTYGKKRSALLELIRFCVLNQMMPQPSSSLLGITKSEIEFPNPYSEDEVRYALSLAGHLGPSLAFTRNQLIIELALHGLTEEEILSLFLDSIDLQNKQICVNQRFISFYHTSKIETYYLEWMKIQKERNPRISSSDPLITTTRIPPKPLKKPVLMATLKFLSDSGDLEFSIPRFNATFILRLLKEGYNAKQIYHLIPQRGNITNLFIMHIEKLFI